MNAILDVLTRAGEPVALAILRELVDCDAGELSRELKRLVKAGRVERLHSPSGLSYALKAYARQSGEAASPASATTRSAVLNLLAQRGLLSLPQIVRSLAGEAGEATVRRSLFNAVKDGRVQRIKGPSVHKSLYCVAGPAPTLEQIEAAIVLAGWKLPPAAATPAQAPTADAEAQSETPVLARRELRKVEPAAEAPQSQIAQPLETAASPAPFALAEAQPADLNDPVGLYARLCAICDDAADLAIDGLAKQLPTPVLQSILRASADLNRAVRALARRRA